MTQLQAMSGDGGAKRSVFSHLNLRYPTDPVIRGGPYCQACAGFGAVRGPGIVQYRVDIGFDPGCQAFIDVFKLLISLNSERFIIQAIYNPARHGIGTPLYGFDILPHPICADATIRIRRK